MFDGAEMKPTKDMLTSEKPIHEESLKTFLKASFAEIHPNDAFEIKPFTTGASNLTYLLHWGSWMAVLRRPPLGPLPPKAHDVKRESEFLKRLHHFFPYAPKPYVTIDDPTIMDAPFYIMPYYAGIVLDQSFPDGVSVTPELLETISVEFIHTLAHLHQVDYVEAGLANMGRPDHFLERQVLNWIDRYKRIKSEDFPFMEQVMSWLVSARPPSLRTTIIHNDYKLNNLVLSPDLRKIVAVLDWEMATIGDPLLDLGVALSYWVLADDDERLRSVITSVTQTPGFLKRDALIELYAKKTGFVVQHVEYYVAFAYFKLAVVIQQLYVRWKKGYTNDPRYASFGEYVKHLLTYTYDFIQRM